MQKNGTVVRGVPVTEELYDLNAIENGCCSSNQRTIYSLRHTAICMRIILSQGKVKIFNLAKNAGTSVEQMKRFYADLPLCRSWRRTCRALGSDKRKTELKYARSALALGTKLFEHKRL